MLDASSLSDIAALPWQLQFVLASGYCAYLLAFVGIRHTHKAADTVFGTLAFGLIAFATLALMPRSVHWLAAGASAFGISLAAAALWRKLIRDWLREKLRDTGYTSADDSPRAWDRLIEGGYRGVTQLTVELEDGRQFYCTDAVALKGKPYAPFVLGTSGDVLMYADEAKNPEETSSHSAEGVFSESWGNLLTYIPANQIKRLAIRIH